MQQEHREKDSAETLFEAWGLKSEESSSLNLVRASGFEERQAGRFDSTLVQTVLIWPCGLSYRQEEKAATRSVF